MQDPELPLTEEEYSEWGDPANATVAAYIGSYSPVDAVRSGTAYPNMLLSGGAYAHAEAT